VKLQRTNLIMEFGVGGMGGSMSAPVGVRNFATFPFMPNMEILKQKDAEAQRRRDRLRELSLGWFFTQGGAGGNAGSPGASNAGTTGGSAGASPGRAS
jgi:hypothetical protein